MTRTLPLLLVLRCAAAPALQRRLALASVQQTYALPSPSRPRARRFGVLRAAMNVPSQTLYVQNLNEKIKKQGAWRGCSRGSTGLSRGAAEMKRALHLCFSSYGRVLDVVCLKTTKLRGQVRASWLV